MSRTTATCGSAERTTDAEYEWSSATADAIEIFDLFESSDDGGDPAYLVFRDACEQFDGLEAAYLVDTLDGRELVANRGMWIRGEVCMGPIDEWGVCDLQWCDGEPPPPLPCE